MITWRELKIIAVQAIVDQFKDRSQDYVKRLTYEFSQIELQGAEDYWVDTYENQRHTDENPNGLVFPYLLGLTNVNPIEHKQYEISEDGVEGDTVIATLEDGKIIEIPAQALIVSNGEITKATNLKVGDEI